MIQDAKVNPPVIKAQTSGKNTTPASDDYAAELVKLKQLLDSGIITEEAFTIKKRMILGL